MGELKTTATQASVADFLASVPDPVRRADAETLAKLMSKITGEKPVMWGAAMVGFGAYAYGKKNEMRFMRIGFSPRKAELVVYLIPGYEENTAKLAQLGPHRIGKSCLYIKSLVNIDQGILQELIADAWADMARRYP
jgi:hypothetical protein